MIKDPAEDLIRQTLGQIMDEGTGATLADTNAIKGIKFAGTHCTIELELVPPITAIGKEICATAATVLKTLKPDYSFEVNATEIQIEQTPRKMLSGVKNIIAISSGKGGVGKSAIAANLASALMMFGAKVGILDADIYGPSVPTMFGLSGAGMEIVDMPDGSSHAVPIDKYGMKIGSMGFVMERDTAAIIRGPLLAGYFTMLLEQVEWGGLDFLVIDLPPGTGDIQLTLTQKVPLDGAVVVTTPQELSVSDVRRAISMFEKVGTKVLGVVENMSYFIPPDMPEKKYYIFGKGGGERIAEEKGCQLLGQIPIDISLRTGSDEGYPIVMAENAPLKHVLLDLAKQVLYGLRKANYEKLKK